MLPRISSTTEYNRRHAFDMDLFLIFDSLKLSRIEFMSKNSNLIFQYHQNTQTYNI